MRIDNKKFFHAILYIVLLLNLITLTFISCAKDSPIEAKKDGANTITDIDGNKYKIIKLGEQWWMAENLRVTHYRNGEPIPNITDNTEWKSLTSGAFCYYNNNTDNSKLYGALYNWFAINDSRNIAPKGWHVTTDEDWKLLEITCGMEQSLADKRGWRGTNEGGMLKEAGTEHWTEPNSGATNESGFNVLPGGSRYSANGGFFDMGAYAFFWSSNYDSNDFAWCRNFSYRRSDIFYGTFMTNYGLSVRCVKD